MLVFVFLLRWFIVQVSSASVVRFGPLNSFFLYDLGVEYILQVRVVFLVNDVFLPVR